MAVEVFERTPHGRKRRRGLVTPRPDDRISESPQQHAKKILDRLGFDDGVRFVHERARAHPEGAGRHLHWQEAAAFVDRQPGRQTVALPWQQGPLARLQRR